ncbi:metallophosphatase [Zhengella mangrovi]|uniref:Metallophosphatase n=1 Tax=Zhengella mangrovi TaxID=1982044 RepID=A0A2G1QJ72_9HYPH|nr:metallophosphatase [Zhengella mangrovi]
MTERRAMPPRAPALLETGLAGETVLLDPAGIAFLPDSRTMLVSDLHLEKGTALSGRRNFLPPYDTRETLLRLAVTLARHRPAVVVSLGDSFHDGNGAARLADEDRALLSSLMAGRQWVWISGNHDPDAPAGLPGDTASELCIGALALRHEPSAGSPGCGEIAGHLHPGARVVQRGRSVRRPCFAIDGRRMIMPAFGAYTGALNILDRAFHGLFDPQEMRACMLGQDRLYAVARNRLIGD